MAPILLLQDEEELFSAVDIQANLKGGEDLSATANIGDALGSSWEVKADLRDRIRVDLSTPALGLDEELLSKIPSLPRQMRQIQELSAAVAIAIEVSPSDQGDPRYSVDVGLNSLRARVPAADIDIDQGNR